MNNKELEFIPWPKWLKRKLEEVETEVKNLQDYAQQLNAKRGGLIEAFIAQQQDEGLAVHRYRVDTKEGGLRFQAKPEEPKAPKSLGNGQKTKEDVVENN